MKQLYHNGNVLTLSEVLPTATAVLVEQGRFAAVGDETLLDQVGRDAEVIDLQGQTLMPGFNDAHIHVWKIGQLSSYMIDVRGVASIKTLQEIIRERAENIPAGTWITGRGFNEQVLVEKRMPMIDDLNAISTEHPIYLIRTCAHIAAVNSLALSRAGVDESTHAPAGGVIGKDSSGKLTGIFYETALGLITRHIPPPTQDEYENMIALGAAKLLSLGITSATDPAVHPELLQAYLSHHRKGKASVRFNLFPILLPDGGDKPFPLPQHYHSDYLSVDTVKFFADGGLSGKTAALSRPYLNSTDRGVLRLSDDQFYLLARQAQARGFRIATHAIGDEAIDLVLRQYSRLHQEFGDRRNRLEHFGLPTADHIETMANYRFVAVPQPVFLNELGNNFFAALDDDYLSRCYPVKSLLEKNIPVAFSTDGPVVSNINPWSNIQDSILRKTSSGKVIAPEESVDLQQALLAYTSGSAYAEGKELLKGKIAVGQYADFIIVDRNPMEQPVDKLDQLRVLKTFVGGECLYENHS